MPSKLEQLATKTTIVADTGDIDAVKRLRPVDCTTNPSLLLKAAAMPQHAALVEDAIASARRFGGSLEGQAAAACDELSIGIGAELAAIVPGRVSTEVDANLSFDTAATIDKGRAIIRAYEDRGIGRERILIKIASTWEGIRAAEVLQSEGIDCNLTLLFSLAQAQAAAEAGAFLISPFVGRILDWYVKAADGPFTAETDPGVLSVRAIYEAYKSQGRKTIVMGASFRNIGEIEALAGCDRLTISPALLDELAAAQGPLPRRLDAAHVPATAVAAPMDEKTFRWLMNEDAMATEKLAEGIRAFAKDLSSLRTMVAQRLQKAA